MLAAFRGENWEVLRGIPLLAALFVQEYLPDQIQEAAALDRESLATFGVKFATAILLVVVLWAVDAAMRTRALYAVRRNSELRAFEGVWAQNVTKPERPYSIAIIEFNPRQGRWTYCGVGFCADFRPGADWRTYSLAFEEPDGDRHWFFAGEAHLREYNAALGRSERKGGAGNVLPRLELPKGAGKLIGGTVADIDVSGRRDIFGVTLRPVPPLFSTNLTSIDAILGLPPLEVQQLLKNSGIIGRPAEGTTPGDDAVPH